MNTARRRIAAFTHVIGSDAETAMHSGRTALPSLASDRVVRGDGLRAYTGNPLPAVAALLWLFYRPCYRPYRGYRRVNDNQLEIV